MSGESRKINKQCEMEKNGERKKKRCVSYTYTKGYA